MEPVKPDQKKWYLDQSSSDFLGASTLGQWIISQDNEEVSIAIDTIKRVARLFNKNSIIADWIR